MVLRRCDIWTRGRLEIENVLSARGLESGLSIDKHFGVGAGAGEEDADSRVTLHVLRSCPHVRIRAIVYRLLISR